MSDKNFDNYFRDRLQDHSSPVPADMWQRIIPEKQRRKKFFFWIWSFAGAFLVITGLFVRHRILTPIPKTTPTPQAVTAHQPAEPTEKPASPGNVPSSASSRTVPSSTPASTSPRSSAPPASVPKTPSSFVAVSPPSSVSAAPASHFHAARPSSVPTHHASVPQTRTSRRAKPAGPTGSLLPSTRSISLSPYPVSRRPVTARSLPLAPQAPAKPKDKKQKPPPPKWYVDAWFSPDIALIHLREWSYTTGLRFSRQLGPHFSAKIGLQYSSMGEKAKLDSEALHIRLTTLDIPMLAGYETNIGGVATTFTGGIIFNIHSWNTLGPGFITHNFYNANTGLSLYLGLNLAQPLNKRFSLFAEPYIRCRLWDISNYPALFDNRMNSAGILLGLRYNH